MALVGSSVNDTPSTSISSGVAGSVQQGLTIPITDKTNNLTEEALNKAISSITDEDIRSLMDSIDNTAQSDVNMNMFLDLNYQGFDPLSLRLALLSMCKKHGETVDILKEDIMWMIAIVIYMGNVQAKALSRRNLRGRTIVLALVKKYSVRMGSIGVGNTSLTVTFPRVVATFPTLSTRMANVLPVKRYPKGPFKTTLLPSYCTVSSFASLLDSELAERTREFLLRATTAYSCDFSITVSEGEARKGGRRGGREIMTAVEANASQLPYLEAATTSPVPSMRMKQILMTEFNVARDYRLFRDVVQNYLTLLGSPASIPTEDEFVSDISAFSAKTARNEQLR